MKVATLILCARFSRHPAS